MAIAAQHTGPLHLLITDVMMPGMSGKELRDRFRASHPGMKCLLISGYTADVVNSNRTLEDGVHFLQKPFTIQSLAETIRRVCNEAPG
jgi:FixJ family two-component response regulator